jgi:hypothetical protein
MDLFDFFFPEQAEASHLRRISSTLSRQSATSGSAAATARQASSEVAELRGDVKFLTLVLAAILKRLSETETMTMADVSDLVGEIDRLDGLPDGGLDPGVLRGMLGVMKQQPETPPAAGPEEIKIVTSPYRPRRYRR